MIQMHIQNEKDLYDAYDPSMSRINEDAFRYLKSFFTEKESKKHINDTLKIISDKPIDVDTARMVIKDAAQRDQDELDEQIALNKRRAMEGYAIGIVLSALGCFLTILLDQVLLELISFIGTMAINDAFLITRRIIPDLRKLRSHIDPLHTLRVEVLVNEGNK